MASDTNKRLNGGGGYADYTLTRLANDKSKGDKLYLMVSGFVDSDLVYAFKLPHNHEGFMNHIEDKTKYFMGLGKRILPTFSYKNYEDCEDIELVYLRDNIDSYSSNISGPFLKFLKTL